jgi:hypothetical protein
MYPEGMESLINELIMHQPVLKWKAKRVKVFE